MEQSGSTEQSSSAGTPKSKKSKPAKILPTERINFTKQLSLLRAYAAASGPSGKVATNKEAADIVEMSESTTSMANAFFVDVGFLQRADGGFLPSQEVVAFARAHEWNPETASHKLQPLVVASWFANALIPKLTFRPLAEDQAIADLADMAAAGPDYKPQLRLLIDYMEAAGIVQRDGNMIKIVKSAGGTGAPAEKPSGGDTKESTPSKAAVTSIFTQPTEGVVQFHVSVKVDMKEFAGWQPERITSFFGGIAQVLAAKGAIEKELSEDK